MLWAKVNNAVNIRVVIRIARAATRLRPLLLRNTRCLTVLTGLNSSCFLLLLMGPASLLRYDAAVLNPDDPVCHLCDFRVMGDHHNGLAELLAGHL